MSKTMRQRFFSILNLLNPLFGVLYSRRLRVLAYHTVPNPDKFEKQLQYLKEDYQVICIKEVKQYLFEGVPLKKNAVLITFDDGDISVLENGLPVLQKLQMPSVLFVITDLIDSSKTFWCRWVERVFSEKGRSYTEARKKVAELKELPNSQREDYLKGLEILHSRQFTNEDLHVAQDSDMFIANHTDTHPMVNRCSEEEIERELGATRQKFRDWELEGYDVFAYPNGNWDGRTEMLLKKHDINMAFLFDHKINQKRVNPLRISRLRVDSDLDLEEFKSKVSGVHSFLMQARNMLKRSK